MSESPAATVILLSESVAEAAVAVGVIVLFVASIVASVVNHCVLSLAVRVSDENVFSSGTYAAMRRIEPRRGDTFVPPAQIDKARQVAEHIDAIFRSRVYVYDLLLGKPRKLRQPREVLAV